MEHVAEYEDLRAWLALVEEIGELRHADGVGMDGEVGALASLTRMRGSQPAVLCDRIPGLEPGFRLLLNPTYSQNRLALAARLPLNLSEDAYGEQLLAKWNQLQPVPPRVVKEGPVLENVLEGDAVDFDRFPHPVWYPGDGGAYVGTADAVITRDPDDGWVNVGTYRVMAQDRNHVSVYMDPGQHGRVHADKYFARGQNCPIAISLGHDPLLFLLASSRFPVQVSEYDCAGGFQGSPLDVIEGAHTGLPIPAHSEIVLEGELVPSDLRPEGPFGEWPGYYASGQRSEPTVTIKAIYHRHQPIMLGSPPDRPPHQVAPQFNAPLRVAAIRDVLRSARIPDVKDVAIHRLGGAGHFVVISLTQRYAGHARQAGMAATVGTGQRGRYVIVVDEDIDAHDIREVLWAMSTRSDPVRDIEIVQRFPTTALDPRIPAWENNFNSRAVIDATRPYEWKDQFPRVVDIPKDYLDQTYQRWKQVID